MICLLEPKTEDDGWAGWVVVGGWRVGELAHSCNLEDFHFHIFILAPGGETWLELCALVQQALGEMLSPSGQGCCEYQENTGLCVAPRSNSGVRLAVRWEPSVGLMQAPHESIY